MAIRMVIELDDKGTINVAGPLGDKLLCYGLLEEARNVVRAFVPKEPNKVVPASVIPDLKLATR